MQRLIQDLPEYSCSGQKEADLLTTSAEETLQQALLNLPSAVEESGALVTHDPSPALPAIWIQLVQLFQNLIANAINYQGPGVPLVHVSAGSRSISVESQPGKGSAFRFTLTGGAK